MIQAELKSLSTTDGHVPDLDLRQYQPEDMERFSVQVDAYIGPIGEKGEEVFGFTVCSPAWLSSHPAEKGFQFARLLLLWRWDYALLERAIRDFCRRFEASSWEEVAIKLSRYSYWEFEDYPPALPAP